MSERVFELFDEYAAAYARGERPSAETYLDRAGAERAQLAALLDELVRLVPVQQPAEDDARLLGLMLAEEPPLLSLRVERGLRVDDVAAALVEELELDAAKRAKVKRYYQRLEGGLLDPLGLSGRLRAALAGILGAGAEAAVAWKPAALPADSALAFLRGEGGADAALLAGKAKPAREAEDEVDRLFTGGG